MKLVLLNPQQQSMEVYYCTSHMQNCLIHAQQICNKQLQLNCTNEPNMANFAPNSKNLCRKLFKTFVH